MRFILGLIAILFAVSAMPAHAATWIKYTVSGDADLPTGFLGGVDKGTYELTIMVQANAPSFLTYYKGYYDFGIATFDHNTISLSSSPFQQFWYNNLYAELNFGYSTGWPTAADSFISGTVRGYEDTQFVSTSIAVAVEVFESASTFDGANVSLKIERAVPEIGTWLMMILGMGAVGAAVRRRPILQPC